MDPRDAQPTGTQQVRPATLRIFVCYRREDSAGFARALKTVLGARYGQDRVFMDLDNIAPGELWEDVVDRAVTHCDVLIAVIGTQWLTVEDPHGNRRLSDPLDPVRLEIQTALEGSLTVIPTLLQGAKMPTREKLPPGIDSLPAIQALAITDDWDAGVTKLLTTLDRIEERKRADEGGSEREQLRVDLKDLEHDGAVDVVDLSPPASRTRTASRSRRLLMGAIALLALLIGGVVLATTVLQGEPPNPPASDVRLHRYLWAAYDLVQTSAEQRVQVSNAIGAKDAAALRRLQQDRTDLLESVAGWDVPPPAREANLALEKALHYSAISDGNWASYAEGTFSVDDARAYDAQTVHPAKAEFLRAYNELLGGIDDPPPPLAMNFAF